MTRIVLALALFAGSVGLASAQGVDVDVNRGAGVGQGGVHVAPTDRGYTRERVRRRETSGLGGNCHVVVRHILRPNGERITEHHRICD